MGQILASNDREIEIEIEEKEERALDEWMGYGYRNYLKNVNEKMGSPKREREETGKKAQLRDAKQEVR
jgi:hypothetical protein